MKTARPNFPRRHNEDGTVDLICPFCFLTIATARNDAQLDGKEKNHDCRFMRAMFRQKSASESATGSRPQLSEPLDLLDPDS